MAPRDQEKAIPLCPLMSVGSQVCKKTAHGI